MKKIILFLMLLTVCSLAFATEPCTSAIVCEKPVTKAIQISTASVQKSFLLTATTADRDEIQKVIKKVDPSKLELVNNLSVEKKSDAIIIKGKIKSKFINLIPVDKNIEYVVTSEGNLWQKKNWYDWMFKVVA